MAMRFLRKIENKNRRDKIRNDILFKQNLQIEAINEKIIEGQLRWFKHVGVYAE